MPGGTWRSHRGRRDPSGRGSCVPLYRSTTFLVRWVLMAVVVVVACTASKTMGVSAFRTTRSVVRTATTTPFPRHAHDFSHPYGRRCARAAILESPMYDEHYPRRRRPSAPAVPWQDWKDDDRKETVQVETSATNAQPSSQHPSQSQQSPSPSKNIKENKMYTPPTPTPPSFPHTLDDLVHCLAATVAAVLYDDTVPDPATVRNAVVGDRVTERQPVRHFPNDAGRIGLEVGGAASLFRKSNRQTKNDNNNNNEAWTKPTIRRRSEAAAVRTVSLHLAARLAQTPWEGYEQGSTWNNNKEKNPTGKEGGRRLRPILVYYNTVKQALHASAELLSLKDQAAGRNHGIYDSIQVRVLGDTVPKHLVDPALNDSDTDADSTMGKESIAPIAAPSDATPKPRRRRRRSTDYRADPTLGLVLMVQPTDYHTETAPPGPLLDTVHALQQLVAVAALDRLPVVCLSPRLLAHPDWWSGNNNNSNNGSSGNSHRTAWSWSPTASSTSTFGGFEPAPGPIPWVLRDFMPPSACWSSGGRRRHGPSLDHSCRASPWAYDANDETHVWQSVLHQQHAWHVYHGPDHQFVGCTRAADGRPSRQQLDGLVRHFYSQAAHKDDAALSS